MNVPEEFQWVGGCLVVLRSRDLVLEALALIYAVMIVVQHPGYVQTHD